MPGTDARYSYSTRTRTRVQYRVEVVELGYSYCTVDPLQVPHTTVLYSTRRYEYALRVGW